MTKTKTKPVAKAPAKREKGFWNITSGSRKEEVARALSAKGKTYAVERGTQLGLSKATVTSWIASWARAGLFDKSKATTKSDRKTKTKGHEGIVRDTNGNIEFNPDLLSDADRTAA